MVTSCLCGNPDFNDQLRGCSMASSQCGAVPAPDGRSVEQCAGGGRAAAWAATNIHLGCLGKHSPYWCSVLLVLIKTGDEQMEKVACFFLLTLTAKQNFKSKAKAVNNVWISWQRNYLFYKNARFSLLCFCGTAGEFRFNKLEVDVSQNRVTWCRLVSHRPKRTSVVRAFPSVHPFCFPLLFDSSYR